MTIIPKKKFKVGVLITLILLGLMTLILATVAGTLGSESGINVIQQKYGKLDLKNRIFTPDIDNNLAAELATKKDKNGKVAISYKELFKDSNRTMKKFKLDGDFVLSSETKEIELEYKYRETLHKKNKKIKFKVNWKNILFGTDENDKEIFSIKKSTISENPKYSTIKKAINSRNSVLKDKFDLEKYDLVTNTSNDPLFLDKDEIMEYKGNQSNKLKTKLNNSTGLRLYMKNDNPSNKVYQIRQYEIDDNKRILKGLDVVNKGGIYDVSGLQDKYMEIYKYDTDSTQQEYKPEDIYKKNEIEDIQGSVYLYLVGEGKVKARFILKYEFEYDTNKYNEDFLKLARRDETRFVSKNSKIDVSQYELLNKHFNEDKFIPNKTKDEINVGYELEGAFIGMDPIVDNELEITKTKEYRLTFKYIRKDKTLKLQNENGVDLESSDYTRLGLNRTYKFGTKIDMPALDKTTSGKDFLYWEIQEGKFKGTKVEAGEFILNEKYLDSETIVLKAVVGEGTTNIDVNIKLLFEKLDGEYEEVHTAKLENPTGEKWKLDDKADISEYVKTVGNPFTADFDKFDFNKEKTLEDTNITEESGKYNYKVTEKTGTAKVYFNRQRTKVTVNILKENNGSFEKAGSKELDKEYKAGEEIDITEYIKTTGNMITGIDDEEYEFNSEETTKVGVIKNADNKYIFKVENKSSKEVNIYFSKRLIEVNAQIYTEDLNVEETQADGHSEKSEKSIEGPINGKFKAGTAIDLTPYTKKSGNPVAGVNFTGFKFDKTKTVEDGDINEEGGEFKYRAKGKTTKVLKFYFSRLRGTVTPINAKASDGTATLPAAFTTVFGQKLDANLKPSDFTHDSKHPVTNKNFKATFRGWSLKANDSKTLDLSEFKLSDEIYFEESLKLYSRWNAIEADVYAETMFETTEGKPEEDPSTFTDGISEGYIEGSNKFKISETSLPFDGQEGTAISHTQLVSSTFNLIREKNPFRKEHVKLTNNIGEAYFSMANLLFKYEIYRKRVKFKFNYAYTNEDAGYPEEELIQVAKYKYGQSFKKVQAYDYGYIKGGDHRNWVFFKYWTTDNNEIDGYPKYYRKDSISKNDEPEYGTAVDSKFFAYEFEEGTNYSLVNLYTTYDNARFVLTNIAIYGENYSPGQNNIEYTTSLTVDEHKNEGEKIKIRELMNTYVYKQYLVTNSDSAYKPPYYHLIAVGGNIFDESAGVDIEVDGKKVDQDFEYTIKPFRTRIKVTYHKRKKGRLTLDMTNSGYTGEIPNTRHRVIGSNPAVLEYKIGDYLSSEDQPTLESKNGKIFDGWYYKSNGSERKFTFGDVSYYVNEETHENEEWSDYSQYNGESLTLYPKWFT